jgi:Cu+-exporting ATPase
MQVRTADAPARAEYDGVTFHFCSDKCSEKFKAAPAKYAAGQAVQAMEPQHQHGDSRPPTTDPICGMTVDPATAATADHAGQAYFFCCDRCRNAFLADPLAHVGTPR